MSSTNAKIIENVNEEIRNGIMCVSYLSGIIEMMLPMQMEHFLKRSLGNSPEENSTPKAIWEFMKDLLEVCWHLSTLHKEEKIYDERWAFVCISHQNIALRILEWLGKPLKNDFLYDLEKILDRTRRDAPGQEVDTAASATGESLTDQEKMDLWFSYLFSGLAMLNSDTLDLEGSSKNRRKVVEKMIKKHVEQMRKTYSWDGEHEEITKEIFDFLRWGKKKDK